MEGRRVRSRRQNLIISYSTGGRCASQRVAGASRPKEGSNQLIRQISANCVIPKRVVDRLDGLRVRRAKKTLRPRAVREQRGGRREDDAPTHTHTHTKVHACTSFGAIPGTFSPKLAVASRRGDYKSAAIPPLPLRSDATLAYHTYFVPEHCMSARVYRMSR